uniref:Zf-CRD domain-containing protein n=1 Tax=Mesocestoides corti TaxID=53468 RepID=A0A5K3G591_MESCO
QPILRLSEFQWYGRKIGSQQEKDTNEVQHTISGVASVADSDGRCLTCGSGFCVTDTSHIGVNPLVEGEKHSIVATSCDRGCDFRLCGVTRALNDAYGTVRRSAHEFSVYIAAPQKGPTGEQDDRFKDI